MTISNVTVSEPVGAKNAYRESSDKPSYREIANALIDVLDGTNEYDIYGNTGLSMTRCNEILAIRNKLHDIRNH